jgi:hypothetical protein
VAQTPFSGRAFVQEGVRIEALQLGDVLIEALLQAQYPLNIPPFAFGRMQLGLGSQLAQLLDRL